MSPRTARHASALGHWGIVALGHWGIGALGHWGIGALGIGISGQWGIGALGQCACSPSSASLHSSSSRMTSSSCGCSSCITFISSWWMGFCLASRCAMREAQSEEKSVEAFTRARTTTFIACWPNSRELTVSNWSVIVGATHTTSVVLAAPPIALESSRVSLLSRNGGRSFLLDARISMHLPRMVSDWLMALASSKALPSTPDFFTRSEPARSTR